VAGLLGRTLSSWLREVMPSFVKTLRKWYWTVRALMNGRVPSPPSSSARLAGRERAAGWPLQLHSWSARRR
jgi:hypothetical protein